MRHFIYLTFSFLLLSCSTNSAKQEDLILNDSLDSIDSIEIASLADSLKAEMEVEKEAPFTLFSIQTWSDGKDFNLSFISLAEGYPWNDSNNRIIDEEQLLEYDAKTYNKHTIEGDRRTRFFEQRGINESDSVFIYFYGKDSLIKKAIANLPLTGIISPYVSPYDFPVPEYYFMVGLDLETNLRDEMMAYAHGGFVAISAANPFVRGMAEQLLFKKVSGEAFPVEDGSSMSYPKVQHFLYSNADYDYHVRDFGNSYLSERLLVIRRKADDKIIFNKKFLSGEGTEINPILPDEPSDYHNIWSGKVFKFKPPILIGLQSQSFGCPRVNFVDEKVPSIYIYCDNRH